MAGLIRRRAHLGGPEIVLLMSEILAEPALVVGALSDARGSLTCNVPNTLQLNGTTWVSSLRRPGSKLLALQPLLRQAAAPRDT